MGREDRKLLIANPRRPDAGVEPVLRCTEPVLRSTMHVAVTHLAIASERRDHGAFADAYVDVSVSYHI